MATPRGSMNVRQASGMALALAAAAIAGAAVVGVLAGWMGWVRLSPDNPPMPLGAAAAILLGCGAWFALQGGRRWRRALGYALAAAMAAVALGMLLDYFDGHRFGLDALFSDRGASAPAGRRSVAISATILLSAIAIVLTGATSGRLEDLRQFVRLTGLAIPLFAVSLHVYDPAALSVVDGFENTSLSATIALALLLAAVGFDRQATSLRWQIANIGVVVLAPLVALTVHFASAEREGALAAASERLAATARLGAERQDAVIAHTRQMLTFLARSPSVLEGRPDCVRELAETLPLNPWVRSLYSVDRSGALRCASDASALSVNVADRDYVQKAFATRQFTVSGFILARVSNQPRVAVALPVTQIDAPDLLIVASLDVAALAGPLERLDEDGFQGGSVTVVDTNGVVIARRPQEATEAGYNLADATFVTAALSSPGKTFVAADLGGRSTLFFARPVLDGAGMLIVGAPVRAVVRPVDVRLSHRLLLITAILAASLALGVLGSETFILQPLRRLIGYAGRLEAGDFKAHPDVRAGGEIGALGRALAVSAAAIEDRERRLVEAEALFRGLFDHSPDSKAVIRVEPDGRFKVETWNAAAAKATGLPADRVVGRSPLEVFPGPRGEAIEADLRRTLALGRVLTIEREPNVKGLPTVFEMVQVPLRNADGAIERIFLSARDISERKRVERLKNEFVSTVSHELRTPLTSIAGSLGLLSGGAAGPLSERAKHLITIAHTNSLRLVRLINDILDIEKIEAGRMTFELKSLAVADLLSRAIGGLKPYADEFGVEVELAPGGRDLLVYGDDDRLTQVATNLLSNAIKFSPRGETVTAAIAAEGEVVSITVKDRGPGVPEAFRARLFTKFAQADSSDNRRKGGTGLGLAIVRQIVERHAGAVTCRSTPGEGAEFEVKLPRHVVRDRSAPDFADWPAPTRVLICEDDALVAAIMAEQMRDAGFEAITAGTVRAALQTARANPVDAVMVDLSLPDGDGLSLIRDLRALPNGRDLPVIVVSASAERGKADARSAGLGVTAWVGKPVDVGRVARMLRQRTKDPNRAKVIHIEDDDDLCNVVAAALAPLADVVSVSGVAAARRALAEESFDLAVLDVALEDGSGLDLLDDLADAPRRPVPTIIFSARDAEPEIAARAEAALTKSRTSLAALVEAARRVLSKSDAEAEHRSGRRSYG